MDFYQHRKNIIISIIVAVFTIFAGRLFYLQVYEERYKQFAERNVLQQHVVQPSRGLIYDRNNRLIVGNQTLYDLIVVPSQVRQLDTAYLCQILDITQESFERRMESAVRFSRHHPSVFISQLDRQTTAILHELIFNFRGFALQPRYARSYNTKSGSQFLGYLSEVERRDLDTDDGYYKLGDYIGVSGLERRYERYLRGRKGRRHIMVDVMNRMQGSYLGGKLDDPATPGANLLTTIDTELQEYGEKLMAGKIGSIVAIEPSSGEILSLVSSPAYDPERFVGRQRTMEFSQLATDTTNPLFNRAISARYPPGSTFKIPMALIGLQEGVSSPNEWYTCRGAYVIPGLRIRCHDHPRRVRVHESMQYSCNSFYASLFRKVIDKPEFGSAAGGFREWRNYMEKFMFTTVTELDLPNEKPGVVPREEYYNFLYGENRWGSSTIISLGIGQAEIALTPLQLANMMAAVVNYGSFYTPHLTKGIVINGDTILLQPDLHHTGIDSQHYAVVIPSLQDVIDQGTAWRARIPDIEWGGKTGTSQNPHGENHSLFVGMAPMDNPQIVIAVVIENAGYGGAWAAPIASLMIEKYINGEIKRPHTESRILETDFINPEPESINP